MWFDGHHEISFPCFTKFILQPPKSQVLLISSASWVSYLAKPELNVVQKNILKHPGNRSGCFVE